jgi:threonine synthase
MFNDVAFRDRHALSAVNSINWARIMAQIVYYFWAALALGGPDRRFGFAVPTGNFGNVFAGYAARRLGLPIDRFVVGSNANDIVTRYLETGRMATAPVTATLSPSMDIQISSNFERLLFDRYDHDGAAVARVLGKFRRNGEVSFGEKRWHAIRKLFEGVRVDDQATLAAIRLFHDETGELLDPHSAIGAAAARQRHDYSGEIMITLATAHPAKFPDAVEQATGIRPALPPALADLYRHPERYDTLANDTAKLGAFIDARLGERAAA